MSEKVILVLVDGMRPDGMLQCGIPFAQEHLGDTCACCGKPADKMIYWGVAY